MDRGTLTLRPLSFAKTRSWPIRDGESLQGDLTLATPPQPGTAFVCGGEQVYRAGARWMRGRGGRRRTKESPAGARSGGAAFVPVVRCAA